MTGRERALRALNFEPVDRVPMLAGFAPHPEFLIAASGEADFWDHPAETAVRAYRRLECDMCPQLVLPHAREDFRGDVRGAWESRHAYASPEEVVRLDLSAEPPGSYRFARA